MEKFEQEKENPPVELGADVLAVVSGGISDAKANLENEYIEEETMIIIPMN